MPVRHFLTLLDLSAEELHGLMRRAIELKAKQRAGELHQPLRGKVLGMVFEKTSTRTLVSFEAGMAQLDDTVGSVMKNLNLRIGPSRGNARSEAKMPIGIRSHTTSSSDLTEPSQPRASMARCVRSAPRPRCDRVPRSPDPIADPLSPPTDHRRQAVGGRRATLPLVVSDRYGRRR